MGQAQIRERLLDRPGLERERASADAIAVSAQRMNAMIQDLVDAVRLESGQLRLNLQAVDVHPFVSDLLQRLRPSIETGRIRVQARRACCLSRPTLIAWSAF